MIYGVVFEDSADGVGAYVPDMPGVGVVGGDKAEARALLDQAVQWHAEGMIEDDLPLPDPTSNDRTYEEYIELDRTYVARASDGLKLYITVSSNGFPFSFNRVQLVSVSPLAVAPVA